MKSSYLFKLIALPAVLADLHLAIVVKEDVERRRWLGKEMGRAKGSR
jgi:hypothetical protein